MLEFRIYAAPPQLQHRLKASAIAYSSHDGNHSIQERLQNAQVINLQGLKTPRLFKEETEPNAVQAIGSGVVSWARVPPMAYFAPRC
ncbi:MAG: hypothetical protein R6U56_06645, partial [Opitutales bacterium]